MQCYYEKKEEVKKKRKRKHKTRCWFFTHNTLQDTKGSVQLEGGGRDVLSCKACVPDIKARGVTGRLAKGALTNSLTSLKRAVVVVYGSGEGG